MLTPEQIEEIGLPIEPIDSRACLFINAALDWLLENTTLDFNKEDIESIKALPAGAKLFIVSFVDVMKQSSAVTSESIAGMSQSFSTKDKASLLYELATSLLGKYFSCVKFVPCTDKWRANYNESKVDD